MAIGKREFVARMAEKGHKTKCSCREYFDLMFDTLYELLQEGEVIKFQKMLRAEIKTTPEREARNPQNGEKCIVPERKHIKVKISEYLRDRLNEEV